MIVIEIPKGWALTADGKVQQIPAAFGFLPDTAAKEFSLQVTGPDIRRFGVRLQDGRFCPRSGLTVRQAERANAANDAMRRKFPLLSIARQQTAGHTEPRGTAVDGDNTRSVVAGFDRASGRDFTGYSPLSGQPTP